MHSTPFLRREIKPQLIFICFAHRKGLGLEANG